MIVFEYMYKILEVLGPLVDQWAEKELTDDDEVCA